MVISTFFLIWWITVISQFVGIWLTLEVELGFELRSFLGVWPFLIWWNMVISTFSWFGGTQSFLNLVEHGHFSIWWNTVISQFGETWSFFNLVKGQIISKGLLVSSNSPKKRTNEFVFTTATNSFVRFWENSRTPKSHFEIIWPLVM